MDHNDGLNGSALQIGLLLGHLQGTTERLISSHDKQTQLLEDMHVTLAELPHALSQTVQQAIELQQLRSGGAMQDVEVKTLWQKLELKDLLEAGKLLAPAGALAFAAFAKGTWPERLDYIRHAVAGLFAASGVGH